MACLSNYTIKGIINDCNPNLAGIQEVWLGYYGDFDVEVSGKSVTSITAATGANTGKFEHYSFARQTGSLTSTLTKDETTGTRYYTNEISLQFTKMEAAKHLEVEALAAEQLVGIVHDNNDKYWFVGYDSYLSSTEQTAQTGVSSDELNGYTLTMNQVSAFLPFELQKSQFEGLIDA